MFIRFLLSDTTFVFLKKFGHLLTVFDIKIFLMNVFIRRNSKRFLFVSEQKSDIFSNRTLNGSEILLNSSINLLILVQ